MVKGRPKMLVSKDSLDHSATQPKTSSDVVLNFDASSESVTLRERERERERERKWPKRK